MTAEEFAAVKERACGNKIPHSRDTARRIAEHHRAEGDLVGAYRCPFCPGKHWHVGHVPSMESLQQIADAIRYHEQDPA